MKLYYNKLGSGSPLFILHGLFGMSDNWLTVGKTLAESFEVYLVDLRNFGQSPHSEEWTYPSMAEDINQLMTDVRGQMADGGNQKFILMGHSLGGKVAMQFASMYPEKLEKLIVVDMAVKEYPMQDKVFFEKLHSVRLEELKTRKEADQKLSAIIREEAVKQLLLKNIYWDETKKLKWKFNLDAIEKNSSSLEKTFSIKEGITVPALFIRGSNSNHVLESDIPIIKKTFQNSEFKTVEGAGHWVHADKPEEFVKAVRDFC